MCVWCTLAGRCLLGHVEIQPSRGCFYTSFSSVASCPVFCWNLSIYRVSPCPSERQSHGPRVSTERKRGGRQTTIGGAAKKASAPRSGHGTHRFPVPRPEHFLTANRTKPNRSVGFFGFRFAVQFLVLHCSVFGFGFILKPNRLTEQTDVHTRL